MLRKASWKHLTLAEACTGVGCGGQSGGAFRAEGTVHAEALGQEVTTGFGQPS